MRRYLIDENLSPVYRTQLLYHDPLLTVLRVDDEGAPARGALDPDILKWCEQSNFALVTKDKTTMRPHLDAHLEKGHHVSGVFSIKSNTSMGLIIEQLILIAGASHENEFIDDITYIPL